LAESEQRWPPVILYGVMINHAIKSGDKGVMQAMHKVSSFMMEQVDPSSMEEGLASDWKTAHDALGDALG